MPPTLPADRRPPLPERLGDGQPEALADRLLQADVGLRLEGVDLDRADVVEVVEDLDVGVAVGVLEGLLEELPALGVVGRHRADQRQLRLRDVLGHLAVGVDHPHRVLPGVEARDLGDQRPVDVDPELVADEGGVVGGEGHVLRRERVDRRRDDAGSRRDAAHPGRDVGGQVPDGGVVLLDHRQQAGDRRRVGLGEVDVAAPDPVAALLLGAAAQPDRLRVVDDDRVPLALQALGVDLVDFVEELPLLVAERLLGALQRVVEELGRVEELLLAEDHVPVGVEADVAHQRHDRVEDLRDAAAERGGADVQDALPLERLGQLADPLGQLLAGDVGVVGEGLLAEWDFLKQARSSTGRSGWSGERAGGQPLGTLSGRLPSVTCDLFVLAFAEDRQRHLFARASGDDVAREVFGPDHLVAVDGEDHVAAGLCRGGPGSGACSSPPLRPALSAGPPGTTSAIRPP